MFGLFPCAAVLNGHAGFARTGVSGRFSPSPVSGALPEKVAPTFSVRRDHYSKNEQSEPRMPKRTDIKSILIIGAGPIIIGQACEFDYSGTQACKALKEEGYRIILVNSNPATIMTDPDLA